VIIKSVLNNTVFVKNSDFKMSVVQVTSFDSERFMLVPATQRVNGFRTLR